MRMYLDGKEHDFPDATTYKYPIDPLVSQLTKNSLKMMILKLKTLLFEII
jgi:hypothetical protein